MKYQIGQTLIEVLVALGAAIIVATAITVAIVSALNNAQFTKNQNLANQYAGQGMEIVRQLRDSRSSLSSYDNIFYCLAQNSTNLSARGANGCGQNFGIFSREVNIENNSSSCANNTKASILVSWSDGNCTSSSNTLCHQIKLISCFSSAATIQIP